MDNSIESAPVATFKGSQVGVDYNLIAREFLKALRGDLSQRDLSARLGFSFNQVGKWESGHKQIKWTDIVSVIQELNIDLLHHFHCFFTFIDKPRDITDISGLLEQICSNYQAEDKRYAELVKKWKARSSSPGLVDFLQILDFQSGMLIGWIMSFVDVNKIESLSVRYEELMVRIGLVRDNPQVIYVNAALQLQSYKQLDHHDEQILTEHACCTISDLRRTLLDLVENKIIFFDGNKYHPCGFDFSFSSLRHPNLRKFIKYTTQLAGEKFPEKLGVVDYSKIKNAARASAHVTALSSSASYKIDKLLSKFHNQVQDIVKKDKEQKDHVQIMIFHSFASNIADKSEL